MDRLRRRIAALENDICKLPRRAADDEGTKIQVELDNLEPATQAERAQRRELIQRVERLLEPKGPTNPYDEDAVLEQILVAGNALLRHVSRLARLARSAAAFGEDGLFRARLKDPGAEALRLVGLLEQACKTKPVDFSSLVPKLAKTREDIAQAERVMQDPQAAFPVHWYRQFMDLVESHVATACSSSGRAGDCTEIVAKVMCADSGMQALLGDFVGLKFALKQEIAALSGKLQKLKDGHPVFSLLDPGSWTENQLTGRSIKELRALCKLYGIECMERGLEKTDLIAKLSPILCKGTQGKTAYSLRLVTAQKADGLVEESPGKKRRL